MTDFGIFVELEEGVEGLIHVSEISNEKVKTPVGMFNNGDTISAKVVSVSRRDRKIALSLRRLEEEGDRPAYREYLNSAQAATSNLGELLKEGLAQKEATLTDEEPAEKQEAEPEPAAEAESAAESAAEPEAEAPSEEPAEKEAEPEEKPADEAEAEPKKD